MGISLRDLDCVVILHGHLDHTEGLIPLTRHLIEAKINFIPHKVPELITHPRCFYPRPNSLLPNIGSLLNEDETRRQFLVNLSDKPVWITEELVFLGEISRNAEDCTARRKFGV